MTSSPKRGESPRHDRITVAPSGYIPKPLWLCGQNLRKWAKEQAGQVPPEVEAWIEHLEETAALANNLEQARMQLEIESRALDRFGTDVSPAVIRKIERRRAEMNVAMGALKRHLRSKGPGETSKQAAGN